VPSIMRLRAGAIIKILSLLLSGAIINTPEMIYFKKIHLKCDNVLLEKDTCVSLVGTLYIAFA